MTESAEDRSKRKFCDHLTSYEWTSQISAFYEDQDVAIESVIIEGAKLRKALARAFPESVFLWRLMIKHRSGQGPFPYWTAFTTESMNRKDLTRYFKKLGCNPSVRKVTEEKVASFGRAVMTQRPHDLNRVLGDRKINRFSLVNGNSVQRVKGDKVATEVLQVEEYPF